MLNNIWNKVKIQYVLIKDGTCADVILILHGCGFQFSSKFLHLNKMLYSYIVSIDTLLINDNDTLLINDTLNFSNGFACSPAAAGAIAGQLEWQDPVVAGLCRCELGRWGLPGAWQCGFPRCGCFWVSNQDSQIAGTYFPSNYRLNYHKTWLSLRKRAMKLAILALHSSRFWYWWW